MRGGDTALYSILGVVDPNPHLVPYHFGNPNPHPHEKNQDPDPHQIKIRIRLVWSRWQRRGHEHGLLSFSSSNQQDPMIGGTISGLLTSFIEQKNIFEESCLVRYATGNQSTNCRYWYFSRQDNSTIDGVSRPIISSLLHYTNQFSSSR